jgi:3alpha(or 20beta)-hydroxysteroid dehydrogenase
MHLDVTSAQDWSAAVAWAASTYGGLDVLVNNAGVFGLMPLEHLDMDAYMRIVSVNQIGPVLGMRAVIPSLKARGGGSIVNISSANGFIGISGGAAYVSSKFAVRGLTKVAALELGQYGIRVNSVHPGGIRTPMVFNEDVSTNISDDVEAHFRDFPLQRMGLPEEIANLVLFLASNESSYSTGSEFVADGGQMSGLYIEGIA